MAQCVRALFVCCFFWGCGESEERVSQQSATQNTQPTKAVEINVDEQGRALHGYDPVAYAIEGKAVAGNAMFRYTWRQAEWWFTSAESRDAFVVEPEKYAPAVGGYCTFGIVLGKKLDGDPKIWLREKEQLYVFLNSEVKAKFLQDQMGNLTKVQSNWPQIKSRSPEELE